MLTASEDDQLGINVHPSQVRLKATSGDVDYAWRVLDKDLAPLFEKHLSKHSAGVYMQLCSEIGKSFHAVGLNDMENVQSVRST